MKILKEKNSIIEVNNLIDGFNNRWHTKEQIWWNRGQVLESIQIIAKGERRECKNTEMIIKAMWIWCQSQM